MNQEFPFFSIIIPTFNRPNQLIACLQSLVYLEYPRDRFEVLVVNDGSEKPLDGIVSQFRHQIRITLITQIHDGPATARNRGASQAMGRFLAFTDDDCQPAPDWLRNLAARFTTRPDHALGGQTLNALPDNLYSTASQLIIHYLYAYYNSDPDQARFFTSNNLAVPAEGFHKIGGFSKTFPLAAGEDREFCERWLRHGYGMTYAPEALIYHIHGFNFQTFWRKHFTYGRGAYRYHYLKDQQSTGTFRPDPKFYFQLMFNPLKQHQKKRGLITSLLMISQIANGMGFLQEGIKCIWKRLQ